jgi:hypothetical protein
MKPVLVGLLILASAGLVAAPQDQPQCRDTARAAANVSQRVSVPQEAGAAGARLGLVELIRKRTGVGVAADCIESRSSGFRAQGNVTLMVGEIVITADDAVVNEREIQLTGNSRVQLPAK